LPGRSTSWWASTVPPRAAALAAASDLLGSRLGRVTLATVVPYDGGLEHERVAQAALEREGAAVGRSLRLEILHGRPSRALMDRAVQDGYGLLVIRNDTALAGGKGANLGELAGAGLPVPPGFVVTAEAFLTSMEQGGVRSELHELQAQAAANANRLEELRTGFPPTPPWASTACPSAATT